MSQKAGAGATAFSWTRWQCGLNNPVTAFAGHPGPDDAIYDEPSEDIFQLFGHILAQAAQITAAFAALTGAQNLFITRQGWRQGFLLWLWDRGFFRRRSSCGHGLFLFQLKLQIKLVRRFRLRPEPVALMACKLMLQLLDLQRLRLGQFNQTFRRYAHFGGIRRQRFGRCKHARPIADRRINGNPTPLDLLINFLPSRAGTSVAACANQSPPAASTVAQILPSLALGHTNLPFSRRLENMHAPWPAHHTIFTSSLRRPQNTTRYQE